MAFSKMINNPNIVINGHTIQWDYDLQRYVVWCKNQVVGRKERLREAIELARGESHVNS